MNEDAFFDALSGRTPPAAGDPGARLGERARALARAAAEQEAIGLAQQAKTGAGMPQDPLHAAVWSRLVAQGRVAPAAGTGPRASAAPGRSRWARLRDAWRGAFQHHGWQKGVALGALAVMGVLVVGQLDHGSRSDGLTEDADRDAVVKGGSEVVFADDAAARQASLRAAFEAAGARVTSVKTGTAPDRWMLKVTLADPGMLDAANRVRAEAGLLPTLSLEFVFTVVARKP